MIYNVNSAKNRRFIARAEESGRVGTTRRPVDPASFLGQSQQVVRYGNGCGSSSVVLLKPYRNASGLSRFFSPYRPYTRTSRIRWTRSQGAIVSSTEKEGFFCVLKLHTHPAFRDSHRSVDVRFAPRQVVEIRFAVGTKIETIDTTAVVSSVSSSYDGSELRKYLSKPV